MERELGGIILAGSNGLNGRPSMFELFGQLAIVTGAATGIGEAIARRLASAGATVALIDLNLEGAEAVAASLGNGSFAIKTDVADCVEVNQAVKAVLARTGRIDVLINNAGIAGPPAPVWEQTDENWQWNLAVNLTGFLTSACSGTAYA